MLKLSFKTNLTVWYSLILTISLSIFGYLIYSELRNSFQIALDNSLSNVCNSIAETLLKTSPEFDKNYLLETPFSKNNSKEINKNNIDFEKKRTSEYILWSSILQEINFSVRNYYIQIHDKKGHLIYKTDNLKNIKLPDFKNVNFDTKKLYIEINSSKARLYVLKRNNNIISVAYSLKDNKMFFRKFLYYMLLIFPIIVVISGTGGFILANSAMKPVAKIIEAADEIKGSSLSKRIENISNNDEISNLTDTMNSMLERLENSFSQIQKFSSDVSHELKTPLTILRGELELALQTSKPDYETVLISSLEEVVRLSNVVETLLELSRADSGKIALKPKYDNYSNLLNDITDDLEILASEKNIRVERNIDKNLEADFDWNRMYQALLNLMDNSVKYTPEGGKVFIEACTEKEGSIIKICISDSGMGISPEELPMIFDRFFRVDTARRSDIQGSGLGLSIVRWIIGSHKGSINVESEVGIGTKFIISLPAKPDFDTFV